MTSVPSYMKSGIANDLKSLILLEGHVTSAPMVHGLLMSARGLH